MRQLVCSALLAWLPSDPASRGGDMACVGYCIGGAALTTWMAWANAHFAKKDVPVESVTLLTTLVDYHKPGDIEVFLDEGSFKWLEKSMAEKGYLDGKEMASAFRLLRSNSLVWHYVVRGYLFGEAPPAFDVLFWNMDTTRMPYAMHAWYLRELYLNNRLIDKDALTVAGEPIDLSRITQPVYAVGAEDDHIAPWRQAFKTLNHVSGPKRFVLSSSGHILGIVNPPVDPPKRRFWVGPARRTDTAEGWQGGAVDSYIPPPPLGHNDPWPYRTVTCSLPVPARNHTWGSLKSLYH